MEAFLGKQLVFIADALSGIYWEMEKLEPDNDLAPPQMESLKVRLQRLLEESRALQLKGTITIISRIYVTAQRRILTPRVALLFLKEAKNRFQEEIAPMMCVQIDQTKRVFRNSDPFGVEVSDRFPKAKYDILEASMCLLFERYTASVFHSMRVAEHGLLYLAKRFKIQTKNRTWGPIIGEIETAIKAIGALPNTTKGKKATQQFYSRAAVQITYFKDAWRNETMHSSVTYEYQEAREVFEHVKAFMTALSRKRK